MSVLRQIRSLNRKQWHAFLASFLGWTLDAFDFSLLPFVASHVATEFHVGLPAILLGVTITLVMRPVGAFIFGLIADRFGRRIPLLIDILFFSAMELLTAFAPNYTIFLILRALFGIGMGGEWGAGSSLAMESVPGEARGFFSGIYQQGYALGNLLGAVTFYGVFSLIPGLGWRAMFVISALPSILVFFLRLGVPESPTWEQERALARQRGRGPGIWVTIASKFPLFIYLVILMTAFNSMSHGTQDSYPTFLQAQFLLGYSKTSIVALTATLSGIGYVGAICGGMYFGQSSERWGRRRAIIVAAVLGLLLIPFWIGMVRIPYVNMVVSMGIGVFLMQFMVQGAFGVIPAHLNELSPGAVRGTFPSLAYQFGNLFAAWIVTIEAIVAQNLGSVKAPNYMIALALFAAVSFMAVIIVTAIGKEAKGIEFIATNVEVVTPEKVKSW